MNKNFPNLSADVLTEIFSALDLKLPETEQYRTSPIDGAAMASPAETTAKEYEDKIKKAQAAFAEWRLVPAPKRGELVRRIGERLRQHKENLARLITLEMGKIIAESRGEIQEAIDMADFSVGLSRQLYGLTIASERPGHRLMETWHPLGLAGVITAFNFPVAVWAWNAFLGAVCGDVIIWKPSELTPLCATAVNAICARECVAMGMPQVFEVTYGGAGAGERVVSDTRIALISATGSCRMGKEVASKVGQRFGKCILELGGNNALIVLEDADKELALKSILFGVVGTAGQRCTSTRRIFVARKIAGEMKQKLIAAFKAVRIGSPFEESTMMGPVVGAAARGSYFNSLKVAKEQGGEIVYGGEQATFASSARAASAGLNSALYLLPTLVAVREHLPIMEDETFAPIAFIMEVDSVEQAILLNNRVAQGLSSAIFTSDVRAAELFISSAGSDCGIANVNVGTSGAEIGGAFGGEKATGGGREAGSDCWKQYMRRQTNTINFSKSLPLAQGVNFGGE